MSGVIDTNLLVYAFNQDSIHHTHAVQFLEKKISSGDKLYICWPIVYEFLRTATNSVAMVHPVSWQKAGQFIEYLLKTSCVEVLLESDDHYPVLTSVLSKLRAPKGRFLHDCHIATIMKENGISKIYTHDEDFRRFGFLEVSDPIK